MQNQAQTLSRRERDQQTFVKHLFHDDRNSSYCLAWKTNDEEHPWKQTFHKLSRLDFAKAPKMTSTYISRNGLTGSSREGKNCRQVNAMMFDVDCHTPYFFEDVPKLIDALYGAIFSGTLPTPNLLVDTGRGVQIYYVLERSIAFKTCDGKENERVLNYFKDVEAGLANTIETVVREVKGAKLDKSVHDYTRVSRVPGTYNPAARRWCKLIAEYSDYYSLAVLKSYGTNLTYSHTKRFQKARSKKNSGLLRLRLSNIERLQKYCNYDCEGRRELMCFVYYNTATQIFGPDKALETTFSFNRMFKRPLSEWEIRQIAHGVDKTVITKSSEHKGKKGFYPLKRSNIIELLDLSPAEQEAIGLFGSKRNQDRAAKKARTRSRREARNASIVEKFRMGMNQRNIAASIGCSVRTVAGVLHDKGISRSDRYTLEEKFSLVIAKKSENAKKCQSGWGVRFFSAQQEEGVATSKLTLPELACRPPDGSSLGAGLGGLAPLNLAEGVAGRSEVDSPTPLPCRSDAVLSGGDGEVECSDGLFSSIAGGFL